MKGTNMIYPRFEYKVVAVAAVGRDGFVTFRQELEVLLNQGWEVEREIVFNTDMSAVLILKKKK